MDAMSAILSRKSVRAFTGEPISHEALESIVRAGMTAPSAFGKRAYFILSVTDRAKLMEVRPLCSWWHMLETCGALLVVCADARTFGAFPDEFHVAGCDALLENMLLAAHALGLGGVWLGVCRESENYEQVKQALGIPDHAVVTGMAAVGSPVQVPEPDDRFAPEKWFQGAFPVQ